MSSPNATDANTLDRVAPAATGQSNRPFFVVGSGRSGTTLLRLMISGHSRLHVSPETWFIVELVEQLPTDRPLTPDEREQAIAIITGHYRWPDLAIAESTLRAELAPFPQPTLRAITDTVYAIVARAADKQRIGDKTPAYVTILPQLARLYPDAQFIHLLRDGRDVALSFKDAGWTNRAYEGRKFEWTKAVRAARAFAATMSPQAWHEIRYEELVQSPETIIRALCAFLGEAFEPAMIDTASRADLVPEREREFHKRLLGPIDASRAGAWQSRLDPLRLFILEACLGPDLRACGYTLRYAGPAWRPVLAASRAALTIAAPTLMRGIEVLRRRAPILKATPLHRRNPT